MKYTYYFYKSDPRYFVEFPAPKNISDYYVVVSELSAGEIGGIYKYDPSTDSLVDFGPDPIAVKNQAAAYLAGTEHYVVAYAELGISIPSRVKLLRARARAVIGSIPDPESDLFENF